MKLISNSAVEIVKDGKVGMKGRNNYYLIVKWKTTVCVA